MSSYRGLVWSIVAIAGTATAATLAYRYVTRSARPPHGSDDDDDSLGDATATGGRRSARRSRRQNASQQLTDDEEVEEAAEWASDSDDGDAVGADEHVQSQQMVLVAREGNMLLSVFGVVLMVLVGAVSLIISWASEDVPSPADLPLFAPLMWIAIGIFTAASVEVLSQSAVTTPEVPVLEDKTVFPHDKSDFE